MNQETKICKLGIQQLYKVRELASIGLPENVIALQLGIEDSEWRWLKDNQTKLQEYLRKGRAALAFNDFTLWNYEISQRNWSALKLRLESMHNIQHSLNTVINSNVTITLPPNMSPEEYRALFNKQNTNVIEGDFSETGKAKLERC